MNISSDQIAYKKEIGQCDGHRVVEIGTKGGFVLVILAKSVPEVIGTGSHRALARHIAKNRCPEIEFNSLEKSEVPEVSEYFKDLAKKYEAIVDGINSNTSIMDSVKNILK